MLPVGLSRLQHVVPTDQGKNYSFNCGIKAWEDWKTDKILALSLNTSNKSKVSMSMLSCKTADNKWKIRINRKVL